MKYNTRGKTYEMMMISFTGGPSVKIYLWGLRGLLVLAN